LSDINVVVPSGKVVALVGRSGAGKTTVTNLLARFHDPSSGRILLNGTDLRRFRLRAYRNLFGIVEQRLFLFDGTIRDNIAYAKPSATDAEIQDAARRAHAHEFIVKLPGGYNGRVGEYGVKLSGGQQQRLSLARAILASPQILILDEATSSVDAESEQLIQASMETLLRGRTTFVVAHRLSTVRRADLILFLEDGHILESGTHKELMDKRGKYYDMVLLQMKPEATVTRTSGADDAIESARSAERVDAYGPAAELGAKDAR
jgi:ATP-binding cassette subfamily B protein/subfamily B ATP-binding cassette protein MsbA